MESIYYVVTFLCHRTCAHCYDDRFRPYAGSGLERAVGEAVANHPRIIDHFPERLTYLDLADCDPASGAPREKVGRVILAGGEVLLEPVREPVLYSALDLLHSRYAGAVQLFVQTTGDVVTGRIVDELLEHHVRQISVSGLDAYHVGLEDPSARQRLVERLTQLFESRGMRPVPTVPDRAGSLAGGEPTFSFFGATEEFWIGGLWPRGRAAANEISTAHLADNFCNRWSGALGFLDYRHGGSEVSVEPNGNVYPCCIKTVAPIGNLLYEGLELILDRLAGNAVYEALSMGHPERMGIAEGWTVEKFVEKSTVRLPSGKIYQNFCVGCDAFHREVLLPRNR